MAATYITVTNATTGNLSLVGDEGSPRIYIPAAAGSNSTTINVSVLLGNSLLCTTLASWTTSGNITSTRGSVTLVAADFTAWAQGSDMNRSDYDSDDDTIVDVAESIMVNNPTAVAFGASPYVVLSTDTVLLVTTAGGAVEIDLPAVASSSGRTLVVKDEGGVAATSAITIDPNSTETLDGSATSATITTNFGFMTLFCDGTQWLSNSKSEAHSVLTNTTAVSAATYAVLVTDLNILVDTAGNAVEVDLPAVALSTGRTLVIKDEGGLAATNAITIDPNASETLDGSATSATITTNFGFMTLYCDGTQWITTSKSEAHSVLTNTTAVSTTPYVVLVTDLNLLVDTTGLAIEIDLPAVATSTGRTLVIKDEGGVAATNAITIDPNASETIDGSSTSVVLATNFGYLELYCDGTQWLSLSSSTLTATAQAVANWVGSTTAVAATPYVGLATDEVLLVDGTTISSAVGITLPPPVARKTIKIIDTTGTAATYAITVTQNAADTIDGATSIVMNSNYEALTLISDGTDWFSAQALIRVNEAAGIHFVTRVIGHANLTTSAGAQSFDFGAALPADAVVIGCYIDVTEGFTDGVAGVFTADVGENGGVTDAILNGAAIASIAKVGLPIGATPTGWYAGATIAVNMLATVDVDTATAGALTVYLAYISMDSLLA